MDDKIIGQGFFILGKTYDRCQMGMTPFTFLPGFVTQRDSLLLEVSPNSSLHQSHISIHLQKLLEFADATAIAC